MTSVAAVIRAGQNRAVCTFKARVTNALPVEAMASFVTVVETGQFGAVFSAVAGLTYTLAANTHATIVTVARTGEFATVLSGKALITEACPVNAASTVITVIWTDQFRAVKARPRFITNAFIVNAAPSTQAVVETVGLRAVFTDESLLAKTGPTDTISVLAAVQQAEFNTAVIATKTFKTLAFPVQTSTLVLAVVGTFRFGAVGTPPSGLTDAAASLNTPVPTAITVWLC